MQFDNTHVFTNHDDLITYIRNHYHQLGYGVSITRSDKDLRVTLGCDLGGQYRNRSGLDVEKRQRKTGTRLIGCKWQARGLKNKDGLWKIEVCNDKHNHEPSMNMAGHPICRRLSGAEKETIQRLASAGIPARQGLAVLRHEHKSLLATARTYYNATAQARREQLKGRSPIQALVDELEGTNWKNMVQCDASGHITHLFLAHPLSVNMTRKYHDVLLLDCTYKTNRFRMPLLSIVGRTGLNSTFYSCFAFLLKEEIEDYKWALTQVRGLFDGITMPEVIVTDRDPALVSAVATIFPMAQHLLCLWHIEKNILTNCKKQFKSDDKWQEFLQAWTALCRMADATEFEAQWHKLLDSFKDVHAATSYLEKTWLPHKEKFMAAWTCKSLHFGNTSTSAVEGAHSALKKFLQVSTGDLYGVQQRMTQAIEHQMKDYEAALTSQRI